MSNPLKGFFHYSKGERRGTIGLLTFLMVLLTFYFIEQTKSFEPEKISNSDKVIIERLGKKNNRESKLYNKLDTNLLFQFDPNIIGVEEWKQLGFSEKQAQSIEKYKRAGGQFKKKEDLKKLYVVDEARYHQLESYINIESDVSNKYKNRKKYFSQNKTREISNKKPRYRIATIDKSMSPIYKGFEIYPLEVRYRKTDIGYEYVMVANLDSLTQLETLLSLDINKSQIEDVFSLKGYYPIVTVQEKKVKEIININTADTTELKKLKGIGASFASRIVKYRKMLGGFGSVQQIQEVYGIDEKKYRLIENYISVDPTDIVKLNINNATALELKSHPYINWSVANSIFQYRKAHGNYSEVEEIKNSDLINAELFIKIAPYITI